MASEEGAGSAEDEGSVGEGTVGEPGGSTGGEPGGSTASDPSPSPSASATGTDPTSGTGAGSGETGSAPTTSSESSGTAQGPADGSADESTGGSAAFVCFDSDPTDGIIDDYWTPPDPPEGTSVTEAGGELRFELAATGLAYADLVSATTGDRSQSLVRVEVLQIPPEASVIAQLLFGVGNDTSRALFEITFGALNVRVDEDGEIRRIDEIPYSLVDHRWLQFRVEDGLLRWEASPDGTDWQELYSEAVPTFVEFDARTYLQAGTYDVEPNPGNVRLGRFSDCEGDLDLVPPP